MLMASSNYSILFSSLPHSIPISSKFPILSPMIHSRRQHPVVLKEKCVSLGFSGLMEKKGLGGSIHLLQRSYLFESIRRRRNKGRGSEREGDFALEAEILEFMDCSENPNKFPTKKDLINAGRSDLVEAIEENRDWLSKGWELDKEEEQIVQENEIVDLNSGVEEHSDDRIFQERCFNGGKCDSLEGVDECIVATEDSSSCAPSSSGREMGKEESVDEDDAGINGILKRLEKERNLSFGLNASKEKETDISCKNDYEDHWKPGSSILSEATDFGKGSISDFDDMGNSFKPDMWRTWSRQRQSLSQPDFEAAEIGTDVATDKNASETGEERSQNVQNDTQELQSRVQHLELELASTLQLLKSVSEIDISSLKLKLVVDSGDVQESVDDHGKEDSTVIFNNEAEKNFYFSVKAFKDSTGIKVGRLIKKLDNVGNFFAKLLRYFELMLSALFGKSQRSCFKKAKRVLFNKENVNVVGKFCRDLAIKVFLKHITKK